MLVTRDARLARHGVSYLGGGLGGVVPSFTGEVEMLRVRRSLKLPNGEGVSTGNSSVDPAIKKEDQTGKTRSSCFTWITVVSGGG